MYIKTLIDMKNAAVALQHGKATLKDLSCAEYIEDSIQFESRDWGSGNVITYKAAEYVLAVQKDLIAAYNRVYGTNVTMQQLGAHRFLMISFAVENAAVRITTRLSREFVEKLFRDMCEAGRIRDILIIVLGASANISVLGIERIAGSGAFHDEDIEALRGFSAQKTSGKVLIGNVDSGSVYYNGDRKYTRNDLKAYQARPVKPKAAPAAPYDIDNRYMVLRYDYDRQKVFLSNPECAPFWASTELLTMERRDTLKKISDMAIDSGNAQAADLLITANVVGGKICNAVVVGINLPQREGVRTLKRILSENGREPSEPRQASLLDLR